MSAPSPGPVEAKRKPGLSEPWRPARLVHWEGQRAIVIFKGEREEVEAYRVRPVKAPKAKAPRKPPPPECPRHPGYTGCCRGRSDAPPVARSPEGVAAALPPLPLLPPLEPLRFLPSAGPRPVAKPAAPARSRVYMDWIKGFPCLNCEAPANVVGVDPHHQRLSPEDLAVGRKVGDFFCVPLCRTCHDHYEDKNTLPRRTEFESLELMRDAQIRFLALALSKVPAVALRAALRGEVSDAA